MLKGYIITIFQCKSNGKNIYKQTISPIDYFE